MGEAISIDPPKELVAETKKRKLSGFWRILLTNPTNVIAFIILVFVVIVSILAPILAPYDPLEPDYNQKLKAPSAEHWFGTDVHGRDILSRVIWGGRISLSVGVVAVLIGLIIGIGLGLPAGYFGGWVDTVLMRIVDIILTFPGLLLALVLSAALGPSLMNLMIAMGVSAAPRYARLVRSSALTVRTYDYISASVALGASPLAVMLRHLLPNIIAPVIVYGTLQISTSILTEASLSFLGFGVRPPTPSWGGVVADGRSALLWAPWISTIPGIIISLVVIAFNMLGDAFRDALDPRMRNDVSTK